MEKIKNEDLGQKSVNEFKMAAKTPVTLVLDNVRSALNVGSVFRTADAFLLEAIYLCGITAQPPNKEIFKSALGATETVAWQYFADTTDAIQILKKNGYTVICIEQAKGSISLREFYPLPAAKLALIFGHEVNGVQQSVINMSDGCIEIPQAGTKHSLNIAVCSGIVIWDIYNKIHNVS